MTEQEWLVCEDPRVMYAEMTNRISSLSDRRWRLLACAIQEAWLPFIGPDIDQTKQAIETAIKWAETGIRSPHWGSSAYFVLNLSACNGIYWLINHSRDNPLEPVSGSKEVGRKSADLFREVIGNPFRPVKVGCSRGCDIHNPDWLTPTVLSIAQQIYDTQDYTGMPILADAMEEAGCEEQIKCKRCKGTKWIHRRTADDEGLGRMTVTDPCPDCRATGAVCNPILEHLRSNGTHVRGCWVLDLILGKD